MQPLTKEDAFATIRDFIKASNEVRVVAPYFGRGAFKQLGFSQSNKNATIVCDLFSGACNPLEIGDFLDCWGPERVRKLDKLHAKIYWTDVGVVIGSANPSANGLGFERRETEGLFEACVASSDPVVIETWRDFIQTQFLAPSKEVHLDDIKAAMPIWRKNRGKRPKPSGSPDTLFAMMRSEPESFKDRDIQFLIYVDEGPSPEAVTAYEQKKSDYGTNIDFWENWKATGRTAVVEFLYDDEMSSDPYFHAFYETLPDPIVQLESGGTITLGSKVQDVFGLKLPKSEQRRLAEYLAKLPNARTPEGASLTGWELACIIADPRPEILRNVNDPKYYHGVIGNMQEFGSDTGVVRFGILGEGKHPNYQIETAAHSDKPRTFRGVNHLPHDKPVFEPEHLTKTYKLAQVQSMIDFVQDTQSDASS